MDVLRDKWAIAALAILCWAIAATFSMGYYYYQYRDFVEKFSGESVQINLGINYGNGSPMDWYNGTVVSSGMTLLDLTRLLVEVNSTVYPGMGSFLTSINGVENSDPNYWMWWTWTSYGWFEGPVAADRYVVGEGETLSWYYEDTSLSPLPTPP